MRSIIFAFIFLFCAALNARAQEQKGPEVRYVDPECEQVREIKSHQKITVHLRNGEQRKGAFVRAEESGIIIQTKNDHSMQIDRNEILRINWRSWKKGALIGLGIGAGGGAAYFGARPFYDFTRSESAKAGAGLFGLIGFLIGASAGKEQTVYLNPMTQTEI